MHISSSSSSSVTADAAAVSSSSYGFLLRLKLSNDGCSSNTSTQFHIGEYYYHDNDNDNVDESTTTTTTTINYNLRIKQISKTPDHNLWNNWSLVGSCNGLICLVLNPCRFQKYEVCICNPVTREYVNLMPRLSPDSKRWWHQQIDKSVIATGFGYHPCTNEYKIVRIIHEPWKVQENNQEYVTVSVYTLGSGCGWRNKGEFPYQLGGFPDQVKLYKKTHVGLLFNGALHWKKLKLSAGDDQIVSFDLANEEFRLIPSPLAPDHHGYECDQLGVLGGCLCVTRSRSNSDGSKEIWVMNNEDYSWTKKFNIHSISRYATNTTPVAFLKDKILLTYDDDEDDCMKFACYDPKTFTVLDNMRSTTSDAHNVINLGDDQGVCEIEMIPYTASFVSLKALGEKKKVNVIRKRKSY